jgi:hypothetical protein
MTSSPQSPPAVSPAAAAAELLRRRRARSSVLDFSAYTFDGYAPGWHHRRLCDFLDRFVAGEVRRGMVLMPPQHGKSEHVSRRLPAYLLGRRPKLRILATSYTSDLASAMSRDVQKIMDGGPYRKLFPDSCLGGKNVRTVAGPNPLRNNDMFEVVDREGRFTGGFYKSAGIGGGISGRSCDVGIIDDPMRGRADAESPAMRERGWGWYNGDFLSRMHKDSQILLTLTPWHEDDIRGRLLNLMREDPKADQWEVLRFPALREDLDDPLDPRELGEPLWPEKHDLAELEAKKAASSYDWDSLYQLRPRAAGMVEWPDEYFGPHLWFDDWPPDLAVRVLALDPSKGKADKSGDYSAYVLLGVDGQNTLWVDADLDNTRPVEPLESCPGMRSIVTDGLEIVRAWRPDAFVVETNGFQELVYWALERWAKLKNVHAPLWSVNNTDPKQARVRTLGTYFAQRRIRVRNTRGGRLLVQQLRDFPTGLHDDGPDALKLAEFMASHLLFGNVEGKKPPVQLRA